MNYIFVADFGIDHGVVDRPAGPFDFEILGDEISSFLVNGVHKLDGFLLAFASTDHPAYFFFPGGIKKDTQHILAVSEEMLRSSSNDNAVSGARGMLDNFLRKFENAFAVDHFQF